SLLFLTFLAEDVFAYVFDALAFVRLRLAELADFRRHLADFLAVGADDGNFRRLRRRDRDPLRDRIEHVVRIAERKLQVLALNGRTITDAVDFEFLLVALGHAFDEVRDHRARHAPDRDVALGVAPLLDRDGILVEFRADFVGQRHRKLALRALHLDLLALHRGGDAGRYLNGPFADF